MTELERLSQRWAGSGAAGLSGRPDGPPLPVPSGLVRLAEDSARAIASASQRLGTSVEIDGPALLAERAAIVGLRRRGSTSCGGATRLLATADGWIALSLARDEDIESLPAWLEQRMPIALDAAWQAIADVVRNRAAGELIERATLLGMPASRLGEIVAVAPTAATAAGGPALVTMLGRSRRGGRRPVVVDLSSLWAGPLCANLLGLAGARVIKVESSRRPDGARLGPAVFIDLLHGGHETVALDFADAADVTVLRALVAAADVVIESSRPRALRQLDIIAHPDVGPSVWVSITGHGRAPGAADRVGFGDDAAVAGGLVARDEAGPCFCVDAVADPLSGLVAAAAALQALAGGDSVLVDVALSRTAAAATAGQPVLVFDAAVTAPSHRPIDVAARPMGTDTESVIRELVR